MSAFRKALAVVLSGLLLFQQAPAFAQIKTAPVVVEGLPGLPATQVAPVQGSLPTGGFEGLDPLKAAELGSLPQLGALPAAAPLSGSENWGHLPDSPGGSLSAVQELGVLQGIREASPLFDGQTLKAADDGDPWVDPETWDKAMEPEAGAPSTLAEASIEIPADRKYTASPEDWRDEVFYSIFVDRFAKGAGAKPYGKQESGHTWHGGNIRGVIEKLDYIQGLGVTTLKMTSVIMSAPGGYHGYWPVHQLAIDPHYGTLADYKELVAKAHERGMKVVFDLVLNHVGKVFEYQDGKPGYPAPAGPRDIRWLRDVKPAEAKDPDHFYRRGVIEDWNDADQAIRGDFPPDLRHFNAERMETQDLLLHVAKWWMKETDVDGFRLDAYRHMHHSFWDRFFKEIRGYAAELGKNNFLILGEISTGSDEEIARAMEPGRLDAAFNYPSYRRDNSALHGHGPTLRFELSRLFNLKVSSPDMLMRFIDNHDVYRFLRGKTPGPLLGVAFGYLMLTAGLPMLYYGTEQAFRQAVETMEPEGPHLPADPRNREDMFVGGVYKSDSSSGDRFDVNAEGYRFFRRLADLRKAFSALRRGEMHVRWSDPAGPGLFAFSRIHEGQEVLVVINTSGEPKSASMFVDAGLSPPGAEFVDQLDEEGRVTVRAAPGGGSMADVEVSGYGVRVFVRKR